MSKEECFVNELIGYIFAYPDDDYMTMEVLCRKLHKHGLIERKDGEWTCNFIKQADTPPTIEVSEDCISREDLLKHAYERDGVMSVSVDSIKLAPSVVPTTEQSCETCANIYCYQDAYYCDEIEEETEVDLDYGCDKWKPREPKEGEWINTAEPYKSDNIVCSVCGFDSIAKYHYCPNCGAKMKG